MNKINAAGKRNYLAAFYKEQREGQSRENRRNEEGLHFPNFLVVFLTVRLQKRLFILFNSKDI